MGKAAAWEKVSARRIGTAGFFQGWAAGRRVIYENAAAMMFRGGAQEVFQMQLSRRKEAAPIVRDYIVDEQRRLAQIETRLGIVPALAA